MSTSREGNSLPKIVLKGPQGSSATVYQHGAHVTSWTSASGEEVLFVSKDAVFRPPKAIRGGIPICFPQFGTLGPLSQHGFARNKSFHVISTTMDTAKLSFEPSSEDLEKFPHPFKLTITVQVGENSLVQKLEVQNTGSSSFEFTAALHTYLRVSSIDKVTIESLNGLEYFDNVDGVDGKKEAEAEVSISSETDRIYKKAPDAVTVVDSGARHKIALQKQGFPDVVLWNPWSEKAKGMSDFGDQDFKEMVCLEPALAKSGPITLEQGKQWSATQQLSLSKL